MIDLRNPNKVSPELPIVVKLSISIDGSLPSKASFNNNLFDIVFSVLTFKLLCMRLAKN